MDFISIVGERKLQGTVQISGAKNAAVAILPAAIMSGERCVIENVPDIRDVHVLVNTMQSLGVNCRFRDRHTVEIDSQNIENFTITYEQARDIRGSYYLLGALLGRFKQAEIPMPGGCNFGMRPMDLHIKGLEALGATVRLEHGVIRANADRLVGTNIYLDTASVGATINIMIAAVYAEGTTQIENAAKEPHVVDTANFLNRLGANIKGAGTDLIRIAGVEKLKGGEYAIIPDQIEAGTYMIAAAITGGDVTVENMIPKHMDSLIAKLSEMGCQIIESDDKLRVISSGGLRACNIKTMAYPGFPTDLQPQMTALLCKAAGTSVLTETIFEHRFQYVDELKRLGANIKVEGRVAVIEGETTLTGAQVMATDLRAGASLIVAALAAKGKTKIGNIQFVDRGYECVVQKLQALGANITRSSAGREA